MSGRVDGIDALTAIRRVISGIGEVRVEDDLDGELLEDVEFRDVDIGFGTIVNLFDVCSFYRTELLPALYAKGMRPRVHARLSSHPLVDALWDEDIHRAEVLFSCGYSLFTEHGNAVFTFGDERYKCGNDEYGDIFDALLNGGKFIGLAASLKFSTPEQLSRRDDMKWCVFESGELIEASHVNGCKA